MIIARDDWQFQYVVYRTYRVKGGYIPWPNRGAIILRSRQSVVEIYEVQHLIKLDRRSNLWEVEAVLYGLCHDENYVPLWNVIPKRLDTSDFDFKMISMRRDSPRQDMQSALQGAPNWHVQLKESGHVIIHGLGRTPDVGTVIFQPVEGAIKILIVEEVTELGEFSNYHWRVEGSVQGHFNPTSL